jgi:uncharacterized protein
MIRLLLALAGALALAACGERSSESARDWPEASPALWEVTGPNGERGWLFGTIHALPEGVNWRTPAFESAFAEAGLLMVEIENLGDAEAAGKAFDRVALGPPLPPLSERVDPAEREGLAKVLDRARKTERDFWNVETWAAALMLASAVREAEPGHGVDRALLREGKPVDAMESFAAQFDRFDRLPEESQQALLSGIVRESQAGAAEELARAWLVGDTARLEQETAGGFLRDPVLREALLTERNRLFAARAVAPLERGDKPFVAIGAAHLLGPEGLPDLLAARGYTVRRIQ